MDDWMIGNHRCFVILGLSALYPLWITDKTHALCICFSGIAEISGEPNYEEAKKIKEGLDSFLIMEFI